MNGDPTIWSVHASLHVSWPHTLEMQTSPPSEDGTSLHHLYIKSGSDISLSIVGSLDEIQAFVRELADVAGMDLTEDATQQGAGDDGPDSEGDGGTDRGRVRAEDEPDTSDGADSHDVGRTEPEPAPNPDVDDLVACDACDLPTPRSDIVSANSVAGEGAFCSGCRAGATPGSPSHTAIRAQAVVA
jgi:hypothetical protein